MIGAAAFCAACGQMRADTTLDVGKWTVNFRAADARLELLHAPSGARLAGHLAFTGPAKVTGAGIAADPARTAAWRVTDARDGVRNRLALVDPMDNVHGYVVPSLPVENSKIAFPSKPACVFRLRAS